MDAKRIKQNSIKYFDKVAEENEIIREPILCYRAVMEELKRRDFSTLVDIGCGTGKMLELISESFQEKAICGIDISPGSIKVAKAQLGNKVDLLVGDVDDLPLDEKSVDIALNMHSFHHYPHPSTSLKEMKRIIKDGGYLLMVENDYRPLRRLQGNIYNFINRHHQGDVKMYSTKELTRLIQESGLIIESSKAIADHSRLFICRK